MDVSTRDQGRYVFGPFSLDPARRVLTRDGALVALTPTVCDTLLYLVEHPGRVATKEELLDAVWPGRIVEEGNIKQTIFTLRKALGEAGDRMIVTAPGRGYRLAEPVRWESVAEPLADSTPIAPLIAGGGPPPRRRLWAAAGFLVLALVFAGGALVWRWRAAHALGPGHKIVVADFQNRTGDPVFDQTLASVLRIDLGQSPFFDVLSERQAQDTLVLMTRPRDTPLTAALAEEVCARNNADAVMDGAVTAIGARYLLTLTATDCSGARVLAAEKTEAAGRDAVVPALDRLIGRVRAKLGESIRSVERFDVPLADQRTSSLEALAAYSTGVWRLHQGRSSEAIALLQRAIDLDPKFAAAYSVLASTYGNHEQMALAKKNIMAAMALRDSVNERQRFIITYLYDYNFRRDYEDTLRDLQLWTTTYPRDATAWNDLADLQSFLGQYPESVESAKRAMAANPGIELSYVNLARAYRQDMQLDAAWAVGQSAVRRGVAGALVHNNLLKIAYARHDGAGVAREEAWARAHGAEGGLSLAVEEEIDLAEGKVRQAAVVAGEEAESGRRLNRPDFMRGARAHELAELGFSERARALAQSPDGEIAGDFLYEYDLTLAEVGPPAEAEARLARRLRDNPSDSSLKEVYAPEARAALALRRARPAEAIAALAPTLPGQSGNFESLYMLGQAELAAGDGLRAAAAFQTILDHQGWEPQSVLYPLARLGLARALRLEHDIPASRRAYQAFFAAWTHADPDVPILQAAKAEYARLP